MMWNQLSTTWNADDSRSRESNCLPNLRLLLLWMGMACPLILIGIRMIQLQVSLRDDFADGFSQTYEVTEDIPARDGRILTADGNILAGAIERYDLQVHYRYLEQPASATWLRQEASKRLNRIEQKKKELVEQEQAKVVQQRDELWSRLMTLTKLDYAHVSELRSSIQSRVNRIRNSVERRRMTKQTDRPSRSGPIAEEEGFHTLVSHVTSEIRAEIEAHPERYPGTRILVRNERHYPMREVASHLIGSRTRLTAEEIESVNARFSQEENDRYRVGESIGRSGLELQYETHLRGVAGQTRLTKNRRGDVISTSVTREPRHGRDLFLTLDLASQQSAERLLDEALKVVTVSGTTDAESTEGTSKDASCPQGAALVALDIHTGAILAAASAPRFDVNLMLRSSRDEWEEVMTDPRKPLFSRATQMAIAPGSIFKVITAIAAVETSVVHPDIPMHCRGYLDRPDQHRCLTYRHFRVGHEDVRLADALCRSCNVYFFSAARKMKEGPLLDWSLKFGIGQLTGIDLPSEASGHLPQANESSSPGKKRWHMGDTLGLAIGQSQLQVTPLQMARVMAAIANDGHLVVPHLANHSGPSRLDEFRSAEPELPTTESYAIPGLHSETLAHIREGLEMVVDHPQGTAYKTARLKQIRIAGKTGTAETNGVDHAWFAGYAPADEPRIAFAVVLEHGGSGGRMAAPIARDFVITLVNTGLLERPHRLAGE